MKQNAMKREIDYSRMDLQDLEELLEYHTIEAQKEEDEIKIIHGYIDQIRKNIDTYNEAKEFKISSINHSNKCIDLHNDNLLKYEQMLAEMNKIKDDVNIFEKTGTKIESVEKHLCIEKKLIEHEKSHIEYCMRSIERFGEKIKSREEWINQYLGTIEDTEKMLSDNRSKIEMLQIRIDELREAGR